MSLRLGLRGWKTLFSLTNRYNATAAVQSIPLHSDLLNAPHGNNLPPDVNKVPFNDLKGIIDDGILKALVSKPFNLQNMTPVQAAVLPLLPDLALPVREDSGPRDLLVRAKTGTGKTLAFLIPALEARLNSIKHHGKSALSESGLNSGRNIELRTQRLFAKNNVGTVILSPTRELATQIANEAVRLSYYHDMEVRLFVGGVSKRGQMRDWVRGRRDIVVATPGRLRDVLTTEPEVANGFKQTQLLILDEADSLLEFGFREDIDAILELLPSTPERQTFLFSATVSDQIKQVAKKALDKNHVFLNTVTDETSPVHAHIPQYHTVLPKAEDQIPHILRLIAHDQLTNYGKSKIILFLPTTKMTQLYSTILRQLRGVASPAGRSTQVYEIHSKKSQESRTSTSDAFRHDTSGASILVTSDVSARGVDYPGVTRVVQVGIPQSADQYVHRVGRTGRAALSGRGDLVLLPWEIGFVTWQLTNIPLKPLTTTELVKQVDDLAAKADEDGLPQLPRSSKTRYGGRAAIETPVTPTIQNIEKAVADFLPQLDPEAINETFASLLGYYFGKSAELRCQKSVILEGCKDFTTGALGLEKPPFVSQSFLERMGMNDGRTKRFGSSSPRSSGPRQETQRWMGRSNQRGSFGSGARSNDRWGGNSRVDPRDPSGEPEEYRAPRYGKWPNRDRDGDGDGDGGFKPRPSFRSFSNRYDRDSRSDGNDSPRGDFKRPSRDREGSSPWRR